MTLRFVATPAPGGAPVAYTEYRLGSGAWTRGAKVTIRRQGETRLECRAVDTLGDVGATSSATVHIDGSVPRVTDYGHPAASAGHAARFTFRVTDAGSSWVTAKLAITRYGVPVKQYDLGRIATGRQSATVTCALPVGTWCWRVVVHNAAGTRGLGGWHYLEVAPGARGHKRR